MSEQRPQPEGQPTPPDPAATAALAVAPPGVPAPVAPPPAPHSAIATVPRPPQMMGRKYGFLCTYCTSRLEAVESQAGQSGTCPTCGNTVVIPILDYRGRLIDPTSGQIIKQDPHPVHAYAAAGHKAPQIIPGAGPDDRYIKCPRCNRNNTLSSNNCLGCGLPFTMEGTVGDAVSGTNTWAVASLVLGIVGIPGFCFVVPPLLAVIFGGLAMRSSNQANGRSSGQGQAIAGLILGTIGLLLALLAYTGKLHIF